MTMVDARPAGQAAAAPQPWRDLAAIGAVVPAALLAVNLPPSATFLNQAAAVCGWGVFCVVLALRPGPQAGTRPLPDRGLWALLVALAVIAAAAAASIAWTGLPLSLALSSIGLLAAAGLVAGVGATAVAAGGGSAAYRALCLALVVAGLLSVAVGTVQVFAPQWADGTWIALSALEGRASGNLRQPNHLSSLLLWSLVAALWLGEREPPAAEPRPGAFAALATSLLVGLFVFGLVLSASRTGMLGVLALAVWGLCDRGLSRRARWLLGLAPLLYAGCWLGLSAWAELSGHVFGGAARLRSEADLSSSRFGIWSNTLRLIADHPALGVGWGEFNLAWTVTPFPGRPVAFFDHTHNLPLHLAVELGLPLAAAVLALLTWALWRAWRPWPGDGGAAAREHATLRRSACVMVLLVAWHSLLEYPLWYAYFLLPAAFAWGLCLGRPAAARLPSIGLDPRPSAGSEAAARPALGLALGCMLMTMGGMAAVRDYLPVMAIFEPADGAPPLAERIATGQRSWLFSHHADYAAATTDPSPIAVLKAVEGAKHFLLDTRLVIAWAEALADIGDLDRARHLAARLREFRNPASKAFFAACPINPSSATEHEDTEDADGPSFEQASARPFPCEAPTRALGYADFR